MRGRYGLGLRLLIILCGITLLIGCGFKLRGIVEISPEFVPIYVQASPDSHIAAALNENLHINGIANTNDPKAAHLLIHIIEEAHTSRVAAVNTQGKVIDSDLHYRVVFEAIRSNGQMLIERQSIDVTRDYVNPDVAVLGKTEEAEMIKKNLEQDVAERILFRLRPHLH